MKWAWEKLFYGDEEENNAGLEKGKERDGAWRYETGENDERRGEDGNREAEADFQAAFRYAVTKYFIITTAKVAKL